MRSMDSGIWWSGAFEPFYGSDYCQWTNMDLQRLHDGEFRGNSFRFQEGWVVPTVELLRRLSRLGLLIRTRNHILVHLCKPVDSMAPGEFYFQVGHQLPGRFSLKFTRRHLDSTIKIHQTVLELDEERQLAFNPGRYTDSLRETALRNMPTDRILTTIIVLDLQTGAVKRENWAKFLERLNDPDKQEIPTFVERYSSLPCPRNGGNRERRSGSDGNIQQQRARSSSVPVEPEENDENTIARPKQIQDRRIATEEYTDVARAVSNVDNVAERSRDWVVTCHSVEAANESQWSDVKTSLKDDYAGVKDSLEDQYPAEAAATMSEVRRTSIKDEYTGVTEAMTSLSVREMPRKMSGDFPVMEEYTTTEQGVSAGMLPSWTSHHQQTLRDASFLPVTVEEMNRMRDFRRNQ